MMKIAPRVLAGLMSLALLAIGTAQAKGAPESKYGETIALFRHAGASAQFFGKCYGYAVFPTIGQAGLGVGGAFGKGRVYAKGRLVGDTSVAQVSVGFQAGGKAYSQIIFFEDKRALDEFESGNFEFGADASVVAVTAAAGAGVGTTGAEAGASAGKNDAVTKGGAYQKGMAVFTIAKGGLMYEVSVSGQKFTFKPR